MFKLPELPYSYDALEPHIDARTMEIHHQKHHQGYVNKLNAALEGYEVLKEKRVEELLKELAAVPEEVRTAVRNHGGGHFNHSFFWPLLKRTENEMPFGEVARAINKEFENFDNFKDRFMESAVKLFGSGWAWLVVSGEKLEIMTTPNQDSPLSVGKTPVLGVDVWEHAYYLKYQNRRPEYLAAFFRVINWEKVEENFLRGKKS